MALTSAIVFSVVQRNIQTLRPCGNICGLVFHLWNRENNGSYSNTMKLTFSFLLLMICMVSVTVYSAPNSEVERHKRLSCQLGMCSGSCRLQGRFGGGCCGRSGRCYNVCYCYGSGYEYRCNSCDL